MTSMSDLLLESPREETVSRRPRVWATLADLDAWTDAWRRLDERAGGPIEQFDWVRSNAATLPRGDKLHVVAVTGGDALLAAAPLVRKRRFGMRRDALLGVAEHYEPMDLLFADAAALDELARQLARTSFPLTLGRTRADSPSIAALQAAFRTRAIVLTRPQACYPYIALDASWEQPEKKLNSGRRSDLRRARRRAEQIGPITVEIISPRPDEVPQLLEDAFAVEARSWKGEDGTAVAHDAKESAFFAEYASAAARTGILRVCFLRINGAAAAMQVAVAHADGLWLLKIGYDAQFARCSPGMLLMGETIAYAARQGMKTYEFLGRSEAWVEMWTKEHRPCVALRVYPRNPRGYAALVTDVTEIALRKSLARAKLGLFAAGKRLKQAIKTCLAPVLRRAARGYIAGETLADAARVSRELAERGASATIGFWDTPAQPARLVADEYLSGIATLADKPPVALSNDYLSIKLPALRFDDDLLGEVAARARQAGVRLHFDGMWPETVDQTRGAIEKLLSSGDAPPLSCTLPGRWLRSLDDADWAIDRGLSVRVVKGEWADPAMPNRDLRKGYLEVIDRLAGRARHVAVASHDVSLAEEALRRLQAAGTPCNLELLYGLPMRASLQMADRLGISVRVYVPYGEAYMPYALSQVRRKPRIIWWLLRDLLVTRQ